MNLATLDLLLVTGVFLVCLARLITNATAQRLMDVTATVMVGVVLVADVLALH